MTIEGEGPTQEEMQAANARGPERQAKPSRFKRWITNSFIGALFLGGATGKAEARPTLGQPSSGPIKFTEHKPEAAAHEIILNPNEQSLWDAYHLVQTPLPNNGGIEISGFFQRTPTGELAPAKIVVTGITNVKSNPEGGLTLRNMESQREGDGPEIVNAKTVHFVPSPDNPSVLMVTEEGVFQSRDAGLKP